MTREKFISIISLFIVFLTISFAGHQLFQEISKPDDIVEKILHSKCQGHVVLTNTINDETELEKINSDCIVIHKKMTTASNFIKSLFLLENLKKHDYLFLGEETIIIKKFNSDFQKIADYILKSFKNIESEKPDIKENITVTFLMRNTEGKVEISETYDNNPVNLSIKNFKKLTFEIGKIKGIDMSKLKLMLLFHHSYSYIENKDTNFVSSLMKKRTDGLYLKSRGAKIRVLPWEYSNNPINIIDRKGRQYGLDKEEYKKDEASLFHYRTTQFVEKNDEMVQSAWDYSLKKEAYSDNLALLLVSKHLKNIQKEDGSFPSKIKIYDGNQKNSKESLFIQASTAVSLAKASKILKDESLYKTAVKSIDFIIEKNSLSDVSKAYILEFIEMCQERCSLQKYVETKKKLFDFFRDLKNIQEAINKNPVYTGVFLQAFYKTNGEPEINENLLELLETGFKKFNTMNDHDKLRFISYISSPEFKIGTKSHDSINQFFKHNSEFLKKHSFNHRGFKDMQGSFCSSSCGMTPDSTISALLSAGISRAVSNGYHNENILQMESEAGIFLRHLIVTDDDFPRWEGIKSKSISQGGVRAYPGSEEIKFSNTSRVLEYFVNRILNGRTR